MAGVLKEARLRKVDVLGSSMGGGVASNRSAASGRFAA